MIVSDAMFALGRRKGATDFCSYLRGKVDAEILLEAYESFVAANQLPEIVNDICKNVPTGGYMGEDC